MGQPNKQLSPPNLDLRHIQDHFVLSFPRFALARFSGGFSRLVFELSADTRRFSSSAGNLLPRFQHGSKTWVRSFSLTRSKTMPHSKVSWLYHSFQKLQVISFQKKLPPDGNLRCHLAAINKVNQQTTVWIKQFRQSKNVIQIMDHYRQKYYKDPCYDSSTHGNGMSDDPQYVVSYLLLGIHLWYHTEKPRANFPNRMDYPWYCLYSNQ